MSANIIATEKVQIDPINAPPDNEYSFKNGYPIIQFLIAQSDKYLVGKSLRVCGEVELLDNTTTQVKNNNGVAGGNTVASRNACFDRVVGVASTISQVTLSTLDNQTLEMVKQYPRLLSSLVSATHGATDLTNGSSATQLVNSRGIVQACSLNTTRSFSIPIRCGLLSGTGLIPLGTNGSRGLQVQLECAPDSSVIEPFLKSTAANPDAEAATSGTPTGSSSIADYSYRLKNLSLTYDLLVPDEEGAAMMNNASNGALTYNAYSNLYSVVNASDQTVTLNLGASKVQSVIHNIIPTTMINNPQEFSNALYKFKNGANAAPLNEVAYSKAGILFPRENRIDEKQPNAGGGPSIVDSETLATYLNAVRNINDIDNTLASAKTEAGVDTRVNCVVKTPDSHPNDSPYGNFQDRWGNTLTNATHPAFGLGTRMDTYRGGVDFSRQPYSVRVSSELDGNHPNSLFTYVLAESQLNYSPEGIKVSS